MRVKDGIKDDVYFLLGDHLGSTSLTTDANGVVVSELRYTPWGEVRYNAGTTPTKYTYTGQYSDSYINLLWYGSRHYDPLIGRFTSPDTIVPDPFNSQAYDRYSYTYNNPVRYTDPTGHKPECDADGWCGYEGGSIGENNETSSLNDFSDNIPDFEECQNKNSAYICGGNQDMGYIYDPKSDNIWTWFGGLDNAIVNKRGGDLSSRIEAFVTQVDKYEANREAAIWLTLGAGADGALMVLTWYSLPVTGYFGLAGLVGEGVAEVVVIGNLISTVNDMNQNKEDAQDAWEALVINSPYDNSIP